MPYSRQTRRSVLAGALALPALGASARKARPGAALLQSVMANGRFVAYQPTGLKLFNGAMTPTSDANIRADLETLRPWFDGLVMYGAKGGNERVPDMARAMGFRAVVLGVWDPNDATELANALAAWQRNRTIVAGLSLGNEIVFGKRGTWSDLSGYLRAVRARAPGLPLTVTEPFAEYLDHPEARPILSATDFMLVNIHPVFEPWFRSGTADNWTDFVVRVTKRLETAYRRPILVKETGIPTAPASAGFNPAMQRDFYRLLVKRLPPSGRLAFSCFSAFDEPWRVSDFNPVPGPHPEEAHWGLFTESRQPKPAMAEIAKLSR
jgi:exo-beta-1,3-glucanase (GH17 family)